MRHDPLYTSPDTDDEPWIIPDPDRAAETRWLVVETLSWFVFAGIWLALALVVVAIMRRR